MMSLHVMAVGQCRRHAEVMWACFTSARVHLRTCPQQYMPTLTLKEQTRTLIAASALSITKAQLTLHATASNLARRTAHFHQTALFKLLLWFAGVNI